MRKNYLLVLLLFCFTSNVAAQIITFEDPEFKARLLFASPSNQIARNLSGAYFKIDANSDSNIDVSEAEQVSYLNIGQSAQPLISSVSGIENFINLRKLHCNGNTLTELPLGSMPLLDELNCSGNAITELIVASNPLLTDLSFSNNALTSIDISSLSQLEVLYAAGNQLSELDLSGLTQLEEIFIVNNQLTALDVSDQPNLTSLYCSANAITSLDVGNKANLLYLDCQGNEIASLIVSGCGSLEQLNCYGNELSTLNLNNLSNLSTVNFGGNINLQSVYISGVGNPVLDFASSPSLEFFCISPSLETQLQQRITYYNEPNVCIIITTDCPVVAGIVIPDPNFKAALLDTHCEIGTAQNELGQSIRIDVNHDFEIQPEEAMAVYQLHIAGYGIQSIDGISAFLNLRHLSIGSNNLQDFDITALIHLNVLEVDSNPLSEMPDLSVLSELHYLNCDDTGISELDFTGLGNLSMLFCRNNQLTSLDFSATPNLGYLYCDNNLLESLDFGGMTMLREIVCTQNNISALTVAGAQSLEFLYCDDNQLESLDLTGLESLSGLGADNNLLTEITLGPSSFLQYLSFTNNPIVSIDVSEVAVESYSLFCLGCSDLESVFMKNGSNDFININGPSSLYVCADENELAVVEDTLTLFGVTNFTVNSYCSFTPGGTYYVVEGLSTQSADVQSCNVLNPVVPSMRFGISDGTIFGTTISDNSGTYSIPVTEGTHVITPLPENPFFTISPESVTVSFPAETSPMVQNFCITANGVHPDLEISILPLDAARPGFDANYKLIYRNKGTETQSGNIAFTFDDAVLDYVSASTIPVQTGGNLNWSFSDLVPFETRDISFVLNANSPMETPAVNDGDMFNFLASVISGTDESPDDNVATLEQEVVNSFDPNDKTCAEGTTISPDMIGQNVHYLIRFENTGTFAAQNIVVKDMIDLTKFDIATLIPLSGSHAFETRINGNKVEFIFENIMLPFDDATNDGYVAFKIKTLPTLTIGDTFSNSASIYFDYNFPIVTDPAVTTIQNLRNKDFDFGKYFTIYPNPSNDVLNIKSNADISVTSLEIYNVLGQLVIAIPNVATTLSIDVSKLKTGTYFLKINSDKGATNAKFVRN